MAIITNTRLKQMKTPYADHDLILAYFGRLVHSHKSLKDKFNAIVYDFTGTIVDLTADDMIELQSATNGEAAYIISSKGKEIVRKGGYAKYKTELDNDIALTKEKARLEVERLRQSVRKGSFEFWFMILGSIGGFISFIFLVIQFIAKLK